MSIKLTFPRREIIVEHGDIEIEIDVSVSEFYELKHELEKHNGQPLLKLTIKAENSRTNFVADMVLNNLVISK